MKRILGLALLGLSAIFASCERHPQPEPEPGVNPEYDYICQLPVVEHGKTAWVPGDKILVHGGSSDNQKIFTLSEKDIIDDTLCVVNLEGLKRYKGTNSTVKFLAAYPADLVKNEGECKEVNTFSTYPATLLMSGYDTEDKRILFKYITGGMVFTVKGDYDSYELVGTYDEVLGYDQVSCRITDKINVPGQNQVGEKTQISGEIVADGATANKIYFPFRQPYFQDGFKMYMCKAGKRVKVLDMMGEIDVPRDSFIDFGDITSQLTDEVVTDDSIHDPDVLPDYSHLTHISFTETDALFPNPERGFYFTQSFKSDNASLLTASKIESNRLQNRTICYLGFYPKKYMNGAISEGFLQMVRNNMQVLRENGAKCIMRFAYSDSENEKPWDPTPEVVQQHIKDIKPILQEYSDVIMCLQAGFVGVWGEWYYTENFEFTPSTPEDHVLRKQVTDAMLDALPKDRSIGLRTPMFKRNMYANGYRDTLTLATAYNESPKARISGFNDCFGASSSDQGTFDGEATREYWKRDTRYTLMGGETCAVSSHCECEVSLRDCEDYHWTYLNIEYNRNVHNVWKNGGCWDEIERRLGYRLSFTDAYHSAPAAGEDMTVALQIRNSGFAAPMNGRGFEIVLVDGNGKKTVYDFDDVDPRYWFAGRTVNIEKVVKIPSDASGKCTLYLNLPDPKPTLHDNPRFSIRLANEGVWNDTYGYNKIFEFNL
ncbi:MAG: DUF4832 domain-containing protein [Bacteroidales bacterium]|nr:DUF4832 domain-containing protein [Bacteroidales bacterium]